ncbi:MAG: hypothetical protein ACFCBW_04485 [Candidatus Competibacterales bacterium]
MKLFALKGFGISHKLTMMMLTTSVCTMFVMNAAAIYNTSSTLHQNWQKQLISLSYIASVHAAFHLAAREIPRHVP